MKMCQSWSYLWLPLIIALLLSGCFNQSPNISLYSLSPIPATSTLTTKNGPFNAMTIVMPVRLAPQLNQTGMFVRVTLPLKSTSRISPHLEKNLPYKRSGQSTAFPRKTYSNALFFQKHLIAHNKIMMAM
jgi:hypothetical protein